MELLNAALCLRQTFLYLSLYLVGGEVLVDKLSHLFVGVLLYYRLHLRGLHLSFESRCRLLFYLVGLHLSFESRRCLLLYLVGLNLLSDCSVYLSLYLRRLHLLFNSRIYSRLSLGVYLTGSLCLSVGFGSKVLGRENSRRYLFLYCRGNFFCHCRLDRFVHLGGNSFLNARVHLFLDLRSYDLGDFLSYLCAVGFDCRCHLLLCGILSLFNYLILVERSYYFVEGRGVVVYSQRVAGDTRSRELLVSHIQKGLEYLL